MSVFKALVERTLQDLCIRAAFNHAEQTALAPVGLPNVPVISSGSTESDPLKDAKNAIVWSSSNRKCPGKCYNPCLPEPHDRSPPCSIYKWVPVPPERKLEPCPKDFQMDWVRPNRKIKKCDKEVRCTRFIVCPEQETWHCPFIPPPCPCVCKAKPKAQKRKICPCKPCKRFIVCPEQETWHCPYIPKCVMPKKPCKPGPVGPPPVKEPLRFPHPCDSIEDPNKC